jgi:hypothetical protein
MKTRVSSFFVILGVITGAAALSGSASESVKASADSSLKLALNGANQAEPAETPAAPAKTNGNAVKKPAPPAKLSFGVDEVAKMHQNGVESDVILNYIDNSSVPYHLSAEEIVKLHEMNVPSPIITALIRRGAQVQQQAATAYAQSQQKATEEAKAASAYANTYSTSAYAPPPVTYAYTYPTYVNTYPAYVYPSYYYPNYCYSPFYFRFGYYPGYRHFYPYHYRGYASYPHFGLGGHFGFGGRIGSGHVGFAGGFHNGRHR